MITKQDFDQLKISLSDFSDWSDASEAPEASVEKWISEGINMVKEAIKKGDDKLSWRCSSGNRMVLVKMVKGERGIIELVIKVVRPLKSYTIYIE